MTDYGEAPWCCPHCGRAMKSAKKLASILKQLAQERGVDPAYIVGVSRRISIVAVRQEFYYRAAKEAHHASLTSIGLFCGGRDHNTILNGIKRHCEKNGLEHPRDPWGTEQRVAHARKIAIDKTMTTHAQ